MLGIYYGNGWGARSLPFMSTDLLMENGTTYPVTDVFSGGVLNVSALEYYGIPKLSGSFAYAMFIGNAAVCCLHKSALFYTDNLLDRGHDNALHSLLGKRHT